MYKCFKSIKFSTTTVVGGKKKKCIIVTDKLTHEEEQNKRINKLTNFDISEKQNINFC